MFNLAQRKARMLLNRLITPNQWKQFMLDGYFTQKDGKDRVWKFIDRRHYPVECESQQICIDQEREAPDEDLLVQVWLEVIGGRGQELLPDVLLPGVGLDPSGSVGYSFVGYSSPGCYEAEGLCTAYG